jgi:ribosome modulation factor
VHQDTAPREIRPDAGSNGVDAETFLVWLGKIEQEKALVEKARKRYGKIWKLALNAGICRKDLEMVMRFADQDPDAVLRTLSNIKQYAQWMDVPIGTQLSIFEIPSSSILSNAELGERAYRAGYVAGITGKNPDTEAYPADNEHHQRHMEGWHAGQKILLDRIQPINIALDSEGKAEQAEEDGEEEAA